LHRKARHSPGSEDKTILDKLVAGALAGPSRGGAAHELEQARPPHPRDQIAAQQRWAFPPQALPCGFSPRQSVTAEDRFVGFVSPAGITTFTVSIGTAVEVDHLQFGW
jgi:hypothetical protein